MDKIDEAISKIIVLEEKLKHTDDVIGDVKHDVSNLYKRTDEISSLNTSIVLLNQSVKELKDTVTELKGRPEKNWNTVITSCITAIVSGAIAFCLAKFGLK